MAAGGFGGFGAAAKPAAAPAAAAPAASSFGGFGAKTAAAPAAAAPAASAFGGLGAKKDDKAAAAPAFGGFGAKKDDKAAAAPALGGFGAAKTDAKATPAASSFGSTPAAATPATATPAAAPAAAAPKAAASAVPAVLRSKTLDEILNRWNMELEAHMRSFTEQAIEVAKWDQRIIANSDLIVSLNADVEEVEAGQRELDLHLQNINQQQDEFEDLLGSLEADVDKHYNDRAGWSRADEEREKTYCRLRSSMRTRRRPLTRPFYGNSCTQGA